MFIFPETKESTHLRTTLITTIIPTLRPIYLPTCNVMQCNAIQYNVVERKITHTRVIGNFILDDQFFLETSICLDSISTRFLLYTQCLAISRRTEKPAPPLGPSWRQRVSVFLSPTSYLPTYRLKR